MKLKYINAKHKLSGGTDTPKSPVNIPPQQDNECFAHEIGSSCECEYCSENPDCDINEKGKICKGQWEHSEMCAECVLLSGIPRYSKSSTDE